MNIRYTRKAALSLCETRLTEVLADFGIYTITNGVLHNAGKHRTFAACFSFQNQSKTFIL